MKKKKVQRSPGERAVRVFGYILMLLAVIVALYPILWVVLSSFKTNKEILSSGLSLPAHFSLDGYKQALEMAPIFRFFGTSLFISVAYSTKRSSMSEPREARGITRLT